MKYIFAVLLLLVVSGCAKVTIYKELPDGTHNEYEYVRWFNQTIDGLSITTPEGYKIELTGQKSITELAFELGAASVKAGGGGK